MSILVMTQVRSMRLFSIIVELNSVFLGPNEVSMMYAVKLYAKDIKKICIYELCT